MGTNPQKPAPQLVRAFTVVASTFDASPRTINVANAAEVELLIRYARDATAPANNSLSMIIEFANQQGDGLFYRRSIEDGQLTDNVNLAGVDSSVNATIKQFEFVGVAAGSEGLVTYIVRVGPATAFRFRFAETNAGAGASLVGCVACLLLEGTK